eukprot:2193021-Pleurochrysis_carterae.AAC.2
MQVGKTTCARCFVPTAALRKVGQFGDGSRKSSNMGSERFEKEMRDSRRHMAVMVVSLEKGRRTIEGMAAHGAKFSLNVVAA